MRAFWDLWQELRSFSYFGHLISGRHVNRDVVCPKPDALHVESDANRKPVFSWLVRQQVEASDPHHALQRSLHLALKGIVEGYGGLADDVELKEQVEPRR